jgi:hypothetical protein
MKKKPQSVIVFTMMIFDDHIKTHRDAFMVNQITGEPIKASKEDVFKLAIENPNAIEIMMGGTLAIEKMLEEALGLNEKTT